MDHRIKVTLHVASWISATVLEGVVSRFEQLVDLQFFNEAGYTLRITRDKVTHDKQERDNFI